MSRHIVLVHRYFSPDTPPYASILRDIAERLGQDGHRVTVLTCQPSYNRAVVARAPARERLAGKPAPDTFVHAAQQLEVPVVEAPPLARALFAACELDQEIPVELFNAVAKVLAFVQRLNGRSSLAGVHVVPGLTVAA